MSQIKNYLLYKDAREIVKLCGKIHCHLCMLEHTNSRKRRFKRDGS